LGHRRKLEALLAGDVFQTVRPGPAQAGRRSQDHGLSRGSALTDRSDFQDILIVAGQREKASYEHYTALAQVAETPEA
jgi:hypothetical protein